MLAKYLLVLFALLVIESEAGWSSWFYGPCRCEGYSQVGTKNAIRYCSPNTYGDCTGESQKTESCSFYEIDCSYLVEGQAKTQQTAFHSISGIEIAGVAVVIAAVVAVIAAVSRRWSAKNLEEMSEPLVDSIDTANSL
eukprot:TRINITY_DN1113_c0_g1_i1.p1 TRINITY_DN1113_c0_g1~~TRINITY_DN1113_c0_g1_i1.p1  ORF type:complete len:154 (+),score=53.15 TRINITY_DN1113_c0_g1_i1:50-463(+)